MSKVIVYIAQSMDGYIARKDGDISWLRAYENQNEDYGYKEFLNGVSTLIIGSATYRQLLTFGEWPYKDKKTYVLSNRELERASIADIEFYSGNLSQLINTIKSQSYKNIWIVGGAQVVSSFLNEGLVDELMIFVVPVLLASGIYLFSRLEKEAQLTLFATKQYTTGIVLLHYQIAIKA